jgi:hypothetical protein
MKNLVSTIHARTSASESDEEQPVRQTSFLSILINWVRQLLSSAVSAESQSGKENTFQYDHLEGSHRDLHPQSPFKWLL